MIEAKREDREPAATPESAKDAVQLVDLMAALNASASKAETARGETSDDAEVREMPKKRTTKKTQARRRLPAGRPRPSPPPLRRPLGPATRRSALRSHAAHPHAA
ncbi:hypothetical protein [Streptomyces mirabilis]|uniref:hypothetical protein n=1 Tax=Streptomyces mirabilis TaxID=68239 RepID=UPI003690412D